MNSHVRTPRVGVSVGNPPFRTTCGIVVSDGPRLILGHATRSIRWDIPKGIAELGEGFAGAAARELLEETGLTVETSQLRNLGVHDYLPRKRLALFYWRCDSIPDPARLSCSSMVTVAGRSFPEFDRFAAVGWDAALEQVGKNLARVLQTVRQEVAPGESE